MKMFNYADIIKNIEEKYPVKNVKYNDIPLWPFLRIIFYNTLFYVGNTKIDYRHFKILKKFFSYFCKLTNAFFKTYIPYLFKKNVVFLFTDTAEVRYVDGKAFDKISFELINIEKDIVPVVTYVNDKKKNCFSRSIDNSLLLLFARLTPAHFDENFLEGVQILDELKTMYNLDLDFMPVIKDVVRSINYYNKFFTKRCPKRIYVNCYYSIQKMAMTYVAKTKGINVIELQHGNLSRQHYAYNSAVDIIPNPYPNYLLSFGENYKKVVSPFVYKQENIKIVGSFYLDFVKSHQKTNRNLFAIKYGEICRTIITVASQSIIDKRLMDFYVKFADRHKDFFILFVPRYIESYHNTNLPENFVIEKNLDVYQCMQNSNVVSTVFSTCCFEALALEKPVLLVNIDNLAVQGLKDFLVPETTMRICEENSDPINIIRELEKKPISTIKNEGNEYFADGHISLLQKALKEILGGQ